jgi:hypothetical protein
MTILALTIASRLAAVPAGDALRAVRSIAAPPVAPPPPATVLG